MPSTRAPYPIMSEFDVQREVQINGERAINMYSIPTKATQEKKAIVPASGFEFPLEVGSGPQRVSFVFKEIFYQISGNQLFSIDSSKVVTFLGTLTTPSGFARMTANENQVVLADGTNAYVWDTVTTTFTTVVFGFPINPGDITMLDGYIVAINLDTIKFFVSALNDATMWNVLDFALFESTPDQLVACRTLKRRIYFFGKITTEVWYDAGAANFPFRRDNNSLFEHGCASAGTVKEGFELMFYLARNRDGAAGVMMVQGVSQPLKISSPEIDLFLQELTNLEDADAILYKENGLTFYQLNFSTDDRSIVYIPETRRWHELSLPNGSRHPAATHAFFLNTHFIGDFNGINLFEQSFRFFTYNGELIRGRLRGAPFYAPNHQRIRVDRIELEVLSGFPDGSFANQQKYTQLDDLVKTNQPADIILFVSRDGGLTFGNGRRADFGRLGQYNKRTLWHRLGVNKGRRIVFEFEFPFEVPFYILGAYIIYEVLPQ